MAFSIIAILTIFVIELWGIRLEKHPSDFLSYKTTNFLRGICCFPVLFSHIPSEYENVVQSEFGSYAFICVTLFFAFSSYGLETSVKNKPGYLDSFFKTRFVCILIPYILSIILKLIAHTSIKTHGALFVHVLLVYYTVFYFAHTKIKDSKKREYFLLFCTFGYSLIGFFIGYKLRLPKIGLTWYPESLGLCLGILIAYHYDRFKNFFHNKTVVKLLFLLPISLFLKFIYIKYIYPFYFIGNYVFRMTMGISIIVVILLLCSHISVNNSISQKMGKISFEIYLYHGMFIELFQQCNVTWTSNTFICAVLICSVLLAAVMNLLSKLILTHLIKHYS